MICGAFMGSCYAWHTQGALIYTDYGKERMIKMIKLTTAAYFTLIGLSVLAGYALHGIVIAIKKGEFFD